MRATCSGLRILGLATIFAASTAAADEIDVRIAGSFEKPCACVAALCPLISTDEIDADRSRNIVGDRSIAWVVSCGDGEVLIDGNVVDETSAIVVQPHRRWRIETR